MVALSIFGLLPLLLMVLGLPPAAALVLLAVLALIGFIFYFFI